MTLPCINSLAADNHAHEEGKKTEREIWIESKRPGIKDRLTKGKSVFIGTCTYNRAEILKEEFYNDGGFIALDNLLRTGSATDLALLAEHCNAVVEGWLDKHLEAIAVAEAGEYWVAA